LGVSDQQFYDAIQSFEGANLRLDLLGQNESTVIYKDFAHAPSKVMATTNAFKEQFANRKLTACLELHTFSSLNKDFIGQYKGALAAADTKIVYFNPKTVAHKKLPALSIDDVKNAFEEDDLVVMNNSTALQQLLIDQHWQNKNLLLMSSGNFDNMDIKSLTKTILQQ